MGSAGQGIRPGYACGSIGDGNGELLCSGKGEPLHMIRVDGIQVALVRVFPVYQIAAGNIGTVLADDIGIMITQLRITIIFKLKSHWMNGKLCIPVLGRCLQRMISPGPDACSGSVKYLQIEILHVIPILIEDRRWRRIVCHQPGAVAQGAHMFQRDRLLEKLKRIALTVW